MNSSSEWFQRAEKVIPGGVSSPVRSCKHVGIEPIYFEKAQGPYLYSVEGKQYVDFCLSFGPHLLGHNPAPVVKAISKQLERGMTYGACHPQEVELAESILASYPFLDKVRLVNSGTEAVMTAVRLARGSTGRAKIIVFEGCYHGHSDGLLAKAGSGVAALSEASSGGIPTSIVEDTLVVRWGDVDGIRALYRQYPDQIAAILLEPIPANYGLELTPKSLLEEILSTAHSEGSLVIFDEVISGFRLGPSGACGHFDLKPDLVTLGKIIGGGLPLAALAGKSSIMNNLAPLGPVYQAGTLSGNALATAAGICALNEIRTRNPYGELAERTAWFAKELEQVLSRWGKVEMRSIASLFWFGFGDPGKAFPPVVSSEAKKTYSDFFKAALSEGIYFSPSPFEVGFLSTEHTRPVLESVLRKLKECALTN